MRRRDSSSSPALRSYAQVHVMILSMGLRLLIAQYERYGTLIPPARHPVPFAGVPAQYRGLYEHGVNMHSIERLPGFGDAQLTATARELGHWARRSDENEQKLALKLEEGVDGLLELALEHCGLTMERIRELHLLRFSLINPVTDIIDQCVGTQWYSTPNFWGGGVDDAYTIASEPSDHLFQLAMYGELFAPDFEPILNQDSSTRRLSVDTRLEFIKYCLPDFACHINGHTTGLHAHLPDGTLDPRRRVKPTGPYAPQSGGVPAHSNNNNLALTWIIRSTRFRPRYKELRAKAGVPEFQDDFDDGWWFVEDSTEDWRQRFWENIMVCQGLEGLGMLRPDMRDQWIDKIRGWRDQIAKLPREPPLTKVGRQATLEYPYLLGDLRIATCVMVMKFNQWVRIPETSPA
ncbi:hypothetical protein EKO27_g496 [Xylaria grammica]|uniref:Uncharacterized protein n=1 Tax=Xylaria grammica TaxID=363999 RepID=A0A439DJN0_9PEZI|nr:hypothetical protein EKO27_g496 [Xylaria grammica]